MVLFPVSVVEAGAWGAWLRGSYEMNKAIILLDVEAGGESIGQCLVLIDMPAVPLKAAVRI